MNRIDSNRIVILNISHSRYVRRFCLFQLFMIAVSMFLGAFWGCLSECCLFHSHQTMVFQAEQHQESESHHFCTSLSCGFGTLFINQGIFYLNLLAISEKADKTGIFFDFKILPEDIFRPPISFVVG